MDINQLESFISYQLGQKQGWEALHEVLIIVKESKESVAEASKQVKAYQKQVDEMKASLAQMDKTAKAKEADLVKCLTGVQADAENAAKSSKVALEKELSAKAYQSSELDKTILAQTKLSEQLALEISSLQADKVTAAEALSSITSKLADIKAKL